MPWDDTWRGERGEAARGLVVRVVKRRGMVTVRRCMMVVGGYGRRWRVLFIKRKKGWRSRCVGGITEDCMYIYKA